MFNAGALVEITVNIGKFMVGLLISLILVKTIWRRLLSFIEEFK